MAGVESAQIHTIRQWSDIKARLYRMGFDPDELSGVWWSPFQHNYFVSFGDWVHIDKRPRELAVRSALGNNTVFADETEAPAPASQGWIKVYPSLLNDVQNKHLPGQHDQEAHASASTDVLKPIRTAGESVRELTDLRMKLRMMKPEDAQALIAQYEPGAVEEKAGTSEGAIKGWMNRRRRMLVDRSHLADQLLSLEKRKGPKADQARKALQQKIGGIDKKVKGIDQKIKQLQKQGKQATPGGQAGLMKQRSQLATQLDSLSKRKGPKADTARAALQKKIDTIDGQAKVGQKTAKLQSPEGQAAMLKQRSHLADQLEGISKRKGPKAEQAKKLLQQKIDKIDKTIKENPVSKQPKPPKPSKNVTGAGAVPPKRGAATPTIAGGASTAVAGGGPRGILQRAFGWLSNAATKVNTTMDAMDRYAGTKLESIAARIGHRQQLHSAYSDWSRRQAGASKMFNQLQGEYARRTSTGIPTQRFYQMAVNYRQQQLAADGARIRFEHMVGYTKSLASIKSIERLENPYDRNG